MNLISDENKRCGAVILAAGRSERMNKPKAFLLFRENVNFLEQIASTYHNWGCREIVVVLGQEAYPLAKKSLMLPSVVSLVVNDHLEFERFYSVKKGLCAIIKSSYCFIQNVDNPFIDSSILDILYEQRSDAKYVSPFFGNIGGHPVLLNRKNIDSICNWSNDSDNLRDVLNSMAHVKVRMPDPKVLININSQEEYESHFNTQTNE